MYFSDDPLFSKFGFIIKLNLLFWSYPWNVPDLDVCYFFESIVFLDKFYLHVKIDWGSILFSRVHWGEEIFYQVRTFKKNLTESIF